ncbi:hypothetical protein HMPREF1013_01440 [Bacillus sp. 2_A_57_CT2]|nr:hypothetical protein HMPREF1013_01440 [Bacillus sp. 2_A_57_CT2]
MGKPKAHIQEIHYLRAIACIWVLLVHVSASYYYENGETYNELTLFINQISRFGTPIFALISGFLLFYQTRTRGFKLKKFALSRFTNIGVPFIFWSIFYLLFMYILQGANPFESGKRLFLINFAFGNAFYHLYFMSIVFQFYLLFPLLQLFRSRKSWIFLLAGSILTNLYALKMYNPGQFEGIWQVILSQRAFLPAWIFFFIFGGFLAYYWEPLSQFSKRNKKLLGAGVVIITVLAVVEYKIIGSAPSNRATNMINIPIITLFMMGIGEDIKKISWLERFLAKIGSLSMAIYLVHPFVLLTFQSLAPKSVWNTIHFPFVFAVILIGTIGVVKVIQLLPYNQYLLTVPKAKDSKAEKVKHLKKLEAESNTA